jgi:hypothetical protein
MLNQINEIICFLSVFFFPELAATTPPIKAIAIAIQVQKVIEFSPFSNVKLANFIECYCPFMA